MLKSLSLSIQLSSKYGVLWIGYYLSCVPPEIAYVRMFRSLHRSTSKVPVALNNATFRLTSL